VIKAVFSASLLQSSVSHDPLEIMIIWWFDDKETFIIIIINVENSYLPEIERFCDTKHYRSKVWGQEEGFILFFYSKRNKRN